MSATPGYLVNGHREITLGTTKRCPAYIIAGEWTVASPQLLILSNHNRLQWYMDPTARSTSNRFTKFKPSSVPVMKKFYTSEGVVLKHMVMISLVTRALTVDIRHE